MPFQQTLTVSVAILRNVGLFGLFFFSLNLISAFYAGAQRFILLPSIYWSGEDKNAFEQFITQKIKASHLTVESSLIADLMWHKNTRI